MGGGGNHDPLFENRGFSGTENPLDLRPVCKFKIVFYISQVSRDDLTKFKNTFLQIAKLRFSMIFVKNHIFSKKKIVLDFSHLYTYLYNTSKC